MTFEDLFLRSQNQDCLGQILSFLTCNDLANTARACKVLQYNIFVVENEEADVDLIWEGAEEGLTKPSESQLICYCCGGFSSVGSNAREHCHLFAFASKAAKECELSGEIEQNRIKVDGVLADLMHVRGFDANGVAEKKAIGERVTRSLREALENIESNVQGVDAESIVTQNANGGQETRTLREALENMDLTSGGDEEEEEAESEEAIALVVPTKAYHHSVFVRITSVATGKLISEGFCCDRQILPWCAGLECFSDPERPFMKQRLEISLGFQSLKRSVEIQRFCRAVFLQNEGYTQKMFDSIARNGLGIKVTAMVIDRRNLSTRCLFQHDQTARKNGMDLIEHYTDLSMFEFIAHPTWSSDSVQLGQSVSEDSYSLSFHLSVGLPRCAEGNADIVPLLVVNVDQDRPSQSDEEDDDSGDEGSYYDDEDSYDY